MNYLKKKDHNNAIRYYEKAIENDKKHKEIMLNRGD